jgi:hypothetical protein
MGDWENLFNHAIKNNTFLKSLNLQKKSCFIILCGSCLFSLCMVLLIVPFLAAHSTAIEVTAFCAFLFRNSMVILSKHKYMVDNSSPFDANRYADIMFSVYGIFCLVGFTYHIPFWSNFIMHPVGSALSAVVFLFMIYRNFNVDRRLDLAGGVAYERVATTHEPIAIGRGYDDMLPRANKIVPLLNREEKHNDLVSKCAKEDASCIWKLDSVTAKL